MTTQELRNKAADLIEQRGWAQGDVQANLGKEDGTCFCLWTALMAAAGETFTECEKALTEVGFTSTSYAFQWNDAPERTQAEVIALLRGMPLPEPPQ